MMDDFKVTLISHEFPPYTIGGIGSQCYDLAYSLSHKKIDTVVICGRSPRKRVERPNDFLTVIRLPFFDFPPRYFWFQVQNFRVMSKLLGDCTIAHGVHPISSTIGAHFQSRMNKPFVVTCHHSGLQELKELLSLPPAEWTVGNFKITVLSYPLNKILKKKCVDAASQIVIPGLSTVNYMKSIDKNLDLSKISVIYNGVNFEKIEKIIKTREDDKEEKSGKDYPLSMVFFGRLVSTKGIKYLIDAMAILAPEFPGLHLSIIGKGPLMNRIRLRVLNMGLQSRVRFFGFVSYEELIRQVNRASVVVLPSLLEVGPFIAALEAMACKRPLVVFDTPFSREFIRNMENGVLAASYDSKDLAAKIRLLLVNDKLRRKIGQDAYTYVKTNHDWRRIVDKYIEVYKKVAP